MLSLKILNPMQERRKKYEDNPRLAWDILEAGSARARESSRRNHGTMSEAPWGWITGRPRILRSEGFASTHIRTVAGPSSERRKPA